jgi:flagellar biogenesis protein FliO
VHKRISVVERFYLAPKQTLYLVSVDGRELLVGATDSSINLITETTPAESFTEINQENHKDFNALLRSKEDSMDEMNHE